MIRLFAAQEWESRRKIAAPLALLALGVIRRHSVSATHEAFRMGGQRGCQRRRRS